MPFKIVLVLTPQLKITSIAKVSSGSTP